MEKLFLFLTVLALVIITGCAGKNESDLNAKVIVTITEVVLYSPDGSLQISAENAYFNNKNLVIVEPSYVSEHGFSALKNRWYSPEFRIEENKMIFPELLSNKNFRVEIRPATSIK